MSKTFSTADVAKHNKGDDLYIIVDEDVYDLTKFQDEHPGGKKSASFFSWECQENGC
jgi:cytochrome b involved in lipid metabolism